MSPQIEFSEEVIEAKVKGLREEAQQLRERLQRVMEEAEWWEEGRKFFDLDSDSQGGSSSPSESDKKPSLRQAIRTVMETKPDSPWATSDLLRELEVRGWLPTTKNGPHRTRSMLAQMMRAGELRRPERGVYQLIRPGMVPPNLEDDPAMFGD